MSDLLLNSTTNPGTPAAGKAKYWTNSTTKRLNFTDDAGITGQVGGMQGWFNVQDYGVLPSNSAATNVTNINVLIGASGTAPTGSTIYFPAGNYLFNAAWNTGSALNKSYCFRGVYAQSYIGMSANIAGTWITVNPTTNTPTSFIDMAFYSSGVQQTAGFTIEFGNSTQPLVQNCIWSGNGGTNQMFGGISMSGTNSGNGGIVTGCNFGQCNGIVMNFSGGQGSTVIQNCLVVGTTVTGGPSIAGIQATTTAAVNGGSLLIDNVDIIGCVNNLLLNPVVSTTLASVFVSQSFFDQSTGSCVKLTGAGTIARCRFVNSWMTLATSSSSAIGIEIATSGSSTHAGIEIEDCWILNTPAGGGSPIGISVTAASDFSITDSQIAGFTTGVSITPASPNGTTKVSIVGNNIAATGGVGANTTGIALLAGAVQYGFVQIADNNLSGNTTPLTDASTYALTGQRIIVNNNGLSIPSKPIIATSAGINTTETYIPTAIALPANNLLPGTTYRLSLYGTCTTTAANISTFTVRVGTTGTTPASDTTATAALATVAAATAGTSIPFKVIIDITCRAIGASTLLECAMTGHNMNTTTTQGIIGSAAIGASFGSVTATGTFNNNTALFLNVSYKSAATTTTSTFQLAAWEVLQQ